MWRWRKPVALLAALSAAALLSACRESEQDRPLRYEKGVYQGQVDDGLDYETRRQLLERAERQKF